jgi:DNA-directed RNA polymerase specialized sigma24 family protein
MPHTPLDQLLAQRNKFLAFVQRRVPDPSLSEDILQAAYLRAYQHQDRTDLDESATAWFYRRQQTRSKALQAWARELETASQPSPQVEGEICACLTGVIDQLKPEYAAVLRATDLGGQRLQDFAHQHSISPSNAGVRIHRARKALRKQLVRTCGACAEHGCLNCLCKQRARAKVNIP